VERQTHYFDHNATSPLRPQARQAMLEAIDAHWANPHAQYRTAQAAAARVGEARRLVARRLQADFSQVAFTSGATEANGWVMQAVEGPGSVIASAVEHPSVAAHAAETIPVDPSGLLDLNALRMRLEAGPVRLVSVMGANNETGVIQPIADIARICRAHHVPYHCDASQLPGRIPLDDLSLADFVTMSGHKMGGPRGVGALIARRPIRSWHEGGPQEQGLRAGTVNTPGVLGFAAALDASGTLSPDPRDRLEGLCESLGADILGAGAPRLPNTVCAMFDVPGDVLVMALDLEGFAVSTGSACSSGAHKQSAVVKAMGRSGAPVRFSLGADSDISLLLKRLPDVLGRVRSAF
jgi:cysteine desulfurase